MSPASTPRTVLVLGGGPDAEREVSLVSSRAVANALERSSRYRVEYRAIDTLSLDQLKALPGDAIFPVLHGSWGEGGPLQDLLQLDSRPFVGCGPCAARIAMDKVASKAWALRLGIPTPEFHILDPRDPRCPLPFPVIVKPIHEGSTVGLSVCNNDADYALARDRAAAELASGLRRAYMIEPKVGGLAQRAARELTVGLIDNRVLPVIEIIPKDGLYDYQAKYHRNDTRYLLDPSLPPGVAHAVREYSERLARAINVRHVARVDFLLDDSGEPWFLEINTMPGFTDHSLVPKAAHHAGEDMPALCARLVDLAFRDAAATPASTTAHARVPAPVGTIA